MSALRTALALGRSSHASRGVQSRGFPCECPGYPADHFCFYLVFTDRCVRSDVFRQPTDVVKALLLGPPGTTVRLGFHRGTDPRAPLIQVALHRQTPGETLVGVGIIFRSDSSGALFVRQLQRGGPAELSGQVHVGDCVVEVNSVDVFRKPISSFTKLMLGPPGTNVTLGFKRATSQMIEKVTLRRSVPAKSATDADPHLVVNENNIQLRREVEKAKDEHLRLKSILESKRDSLKEVERMYERGTSSMGGQMNDELQRFKTFDQWPHSESSHPGVTPTILAAEGFHFCPTAQDPDTVICFFCDLQVSPDALHPIPGPLPQPVFQCCASTCGSRVIFDMLWCPLKSWETGSAPMMPRPCTANCRPTARSYSACSAETSPARKRCSDCLLASAFAAHVSEFM